MWSIDCESLKPTRAQKDIKIQDFSSTYINILLKGFWNSLRNYLRKINFYNSWCSKIRSCQLREAVTWWQEIGIHSGFFLGCGFLSLVYENGTFRVPWLLRKKPIWLPEFFTKKMYNTIGKVLAPNFRPWAAHSLRLGATLYPRYLPVFDIIFEGNQ